MDELVSVSVSGQESSSRRAGAQRPGFGGRRLLAFVVFVGLLIALFGATLFLLFTTVFKSDLNSYIILVPFVAGYLFYIQRKQLWPEYHSSVGWAVPLLLLGSAALVAVEFWKPAGQAFSLNDYLSLSTLAFVCFVWAGGFLFLGKRWMQKAAFPAAFLIFLVPLPELVVGWLETGSKIASAEAASLFFGMTGTPVLRTGTVFQLPSFTIQVAQECSGIRSTWVLFITSLVAAHLFLTKTWSRVLLVVAIIPLGILRNGIRIMVIGLLCIHVSPDMINSVIHRRGGPLFFTLSLIPLWLLLWFLRSRERANEGQARTKLSSGKLTAKTP